MCPESWWNSVASSADRLIMTACRLLVHVAPQASSSKVVKHLLHARRWRRQAATAQLTRMRQRFGGRSPAVGCRAPRAPPPAPPARPSPRSGRGGPPPGSTGSAAAAAGDRWRPRRARPAARGWPAAAPGDGRGRRCRESSRPCRAPERGRQWRSRASSEERALPPRPPEATMTAACGTLPARDAATIPAAAPTRPSLPPAADAAGARAAASGREAGWSPSAAPPAASRWRRW